ncbi:MAG: nucleotide exchange factor GrpE [Bacteroidetes bacterium]|nr:nucleotide exchange factor GrpE [Bacteroidota bacterium]
MSKEKEVLHSENEQNADQNLENETNASINENEEASQQEEKELGSANEPDDKLAELEREKTELQDKYLRLFAEFENFRRRTILEKEDLRKQANKNVFEELLPVVDDFERGLETINKAEDKAALEEGVRLIYQKFIALLEKKGVKVMESKEQDFDPELHEALTKIPAPDKKLSGKVIDEIEKGYMLHDKVLRHAKVVVAE